MTVLREMSESAEMSSANAYVPVFFSLTGTPAAAHATGMPSQALNIGRDTKKRLGFMKHIFPHTRNMVEL